jgi:hypothetical protein
MPVSVRFSGARIFSVAVIATAAFALVVTGAVGAPGSPPKQGKDFTMVVKSPEYRGVTDLAYTVTLTNLTGTQMLGSADVTVPSQLKIVGEPKIGSTIVTRTSNVLHLRNLALSPTAPNNSLTLTLGLLMPCTGAVGQWTVVAKQSNDFSGSGNNLALKTSGPGPVSVLATALDGTCKLAFVDQPTSARITDVISKVAFTPGGGAVTVGALDARPTGAELTPSLVGSVTVASSPTGLVSAPTNTAPAGSAGIASFANLKIAAPGNYTLGATAPGYLDSDASNPFQMVNIAADCKPSNCHAELGAATLNGTPSSGSGLLLLSENLGFDPLKGTGCSTYVPPPDSSYYEYQLLGVMGDQTFVLEYTPTQMKKRNFMSLDICFAVPGPDGFIAKDGLPADSFNWDGDPLGTLEGFADLLPDCPSPPVKPCVLDRSPTAGGGATITGFAPEDLGDPRLR